MSTLKDQLIAQIGASGPISLARYMHECLLHPSLGYYTQANPLGASGDFTTAPEISQMFGELIGLALAQAWLDQGAPSPFILAELGPGRGTLMADLLRATRHVGGFHQAMELHLVEASPKLRATQASTIAPHAAQWHDSIATLPSGPLFLIANEFLDALPIRQFRRQGDLWAETLVGAVDGQLIFGQSQPLPITELDHRLSDTIEGDIVELCPAALALSAQIGARIEAEGGLALFVDYGDGPSKGDTFQALKGHRFADPLAEPGQADLTAHVDFKAFATAALPARASTITPQGLWLARLGLGPRAERLAQKMTPKALEQHQAATRRLTHSEEMGTLFKVIALSPARMPTPPGFDRNA